MLLAFAVIWTTSRSRCCSCLAEVRRGAKLRSISSTPARTFGARSDGIGLGIGVSESRRRQASSSESSMHGYRVAPRLSSLFPAGRGRSRLGGNQRPWDNRTLLCSYDLRPARVPEEHRPERAELTSGSNGTIESCAAAALCRWSPTRVNR